MKYNTIMGIFVFLLLLNSCNPDFNNVKQKEKLNKKTVPKEETPDERIKNELIGDLRNLIEIGNTDREKYVKKMEEEPENQYGIEIFKRLDWGGPSAEAISANSKRSIEYRKFIYVALNDIDTNDLGEFTKILLLSGQGEIINNLNGFGRTLDPSIVHLYSKKETLDKLDISDLEKLKNYFKELWSIKTVFSKMFNQLLLDYRNDNNLIKTDNSKLRSYTIPLFKQIREKVTEAEELVGKIISI
ncbi:virulence associated lipoprotein [Borreliella turdi]|uniref:virulence associated lipoprotein n=1 Tax=Borreliella turdi TaxID=57863 RepID=UPI0012470381|nr:virulence associated lipoprotein [Borreliella turdi]